MPSAQPASNWKLVVGRSVMKWLHYWSGVYALVGVNNGDAEDDTGLTTGVAWMFRGWHGSRDGAAALQTTAVVVSLSLDRHLKHALVNQRWQRPSYSIPAFVQELGCGVVHIWGARGMACTAKPGTANAGSVVVKVLSPPLAENTGAGQIERAASARRVPSKKRNVGIEALVPRLGSTRRDLKNHSSEAAPGTASELALQQHVAVSCLA